MATALVLCPLSARGHYKIFHILFVGVLPWLAFILDFITLRYASILPLPLMSSLRAKFHPDIPTFVDSVLDCSVDPNFIRTSQLGKMSYTTHLQIREHGHMLSTEKDSSCLTFGGLPPTDLYEDDLTVRSRVRHSIVMTTLEGCHLSQHSILLPSLLDVSFNYWLLSWQFR